MQRINIKTIIEWMLVIAGGYFSALLIPAFIDYHGASSIFKKIIPLVIIITVYAAYFCADRSWFSISLDEIRSSFSVQSLVVLVLALVGWLCLSAFIAAGFIDTIFGCIAFVGTAFIILFILSGKTIHAFSLLLLIIPFVRFLELQTAYLPFSGKLLGPFIVTPVNVVIVIFAFFYFLKVLFSSQKGNLSFDTAMKLYVLFAVFSLVSTILSIDKGASSIGFMIEVLFFPLFYIFIRHAVLDEDSILIIFYSLCVYMVLRLLFSFYMAVRFKMLIDSFYLAFSQIEELTTLATMIIPIAFGLFSITKDIKAKILAIIIMILAISAIVFGDKREPVIALLLTLPFIFLLPLRYKKILFFISITVVIGLIIYYSHQYNTHISKIPLSLDAIRGDSIRVSAWRAAFGMIPDYPLWGIGFGNYGSLLDLYSPYTFYNTGLWPLSNPHNFMLHYLTSIGIVGSIPLFLFIGYMYFQSIAVFKRTTSCSRTVAVTVVWSISCFLISANTGGTMMLFGYSKELLESRIVSYIPDFGILFWLFLGLIGVVYSKGKKHAEFAG